MPKKLIKSTTRGGADYGWLKTNYSFSFAEYYDPDRIHFGALRVLNDDWIASGMGFGMHPHNNMEIVTLVFSGQLEHKDSIGSYGIISKNEVQVMSAGTGIVHSEFNSSQSEPVELFQIWVIPDRKNVTPRYDQQKYDKAFIDNKFGLIVSPENAEGLVYIYQDAYFSLANLGQEKNIEYKLHNPKNGVFLIVREGEVEIEGQILQKRDAMEITNESAFSLKALKNSLVLAIEVPV